LPNLSLDLYITTTVICDMITFIQTGGTIDKDYPKTQRGYAFEIGQPAVVRILEKLNPSFEYEIIELLKKDSLEITADDRKLLVDTCLQQSNKMIVITHGTDTLLETAKDLMTVKDKTIVLTGAMRPERFINSDAPVNVGLAIGSVQTLPPGVYVTMHGRTLSAQQMTRNSETGQFIPQD